MITVHGAGAGIVCGKRAAHLVFVVLVLQQEVAQILRAGLDVLFGVGGIGAVVAGGGRHELHEADGALF